GGCARFPAGVGGKANPSKASLDPNLRFCGMATSRLRALLRRPFVEYGAHSLAIEPETESVFLRKFRDLFFPIFLVYRPDAFQVLFVNHAVPPSAMHPSFDLCR